MNEVNFALVGIVGGLIVGISSTLVGGYTTFMTTKAGNKKSSSHIVSSSLLMLLYMAMILLIVSLFIANIIESLSTDLTYAVLLSATVIAILLGILYIRRYFWHETILKLAHHKQFAKMHLIKSEHVLQPLLAAATLLYTISPVLIIQIILMSLLSLLNDTSALFWSTMYTFGIITPLYAITALVSSKTKVSQILSWQQKTKGTTSLYIGLYTVLLAWILLYGVISNGTSGL